MPKYSIIVPVYKAESTIKECVNSVLKQNVQDFELLLVDDCSPDKSALICSELARNNHQIRVFQQEKNKGVSAARNRGIEEAAGKYILFIDSDDFVSENYLSVIDEQLTEHDFDLLSFGHVRYVTFENAEPVLSVSNMNCSIDGTLPDELNWNHLYLESFFASPCNKVYKRSIIEQAGLRFDEACVCYEDYIFNCQYCGLIHNFKVIDDPLYYYRQVSEVVPSSKRSWGKRFEISRKVAQITNEFIDAHHEYRLMNLKRHTLKSYQTELEVAYNKDYETFRSAVYEVCDDSAFADVLRSIRPQRRFIPTLRIAMTLKLRGAQLVLIQRMINSK